LLVNACGGEAIDLPAVEVGRSPHFRYYARAADRVPATIFDLLEAHRAEMSTFFGLNPMTAIDYYLFDSEEDAIQHGPCGSSACARGSSVYSDTPFHEHELIHSYFSTLGLAPPIIAEGVASGLSCFEFFSTSATPPADTSWQAAASNFHVDSTDYGQSRLVRYLIRQHGPESFARFYRYTEHTLDPALFALQFDRFWGESIGAVWAEATASHASPTYLDVAMCPCSATQLRIDGNSIPIAALNGAQSLPRPFTLTAESDLAVSMEGLGGTAIRNCWDESYQRQLLQGDFPAPPAVLFLHLPAGHYYLQALPQSAAPASISIRPGGWLAADCAAGEVFSVDSAFAGNFEILGPGSTSYLRFVVAGPRAATVRATVSGLSLCPACDSPSTECTTVAPLTSANITLNGEYVVKVEPAQQVSISFP
jgi:hypothetical protein